MTTSGLVQDWFRTHLVQVVEALLQTPEAADAGFEEAAGASVLLKHTEQRNILEMQLIKYNN